MRIAFIGAGMMGYGIALNLCLHNHSLKVIANRNRTNVERLVQHGAMEVTSFEHLLDQAEAIVSCVSTAEQLENIFLQAEPYLSSIKLWIDCTTSKPEISLNLAEQLQAKGIGFVDAPVTRGPKDAEAGRLVSLVGGDSKNYELAYPIISCYSESILHLGPVGSGLRTKLINNFITMGQVALVVEAIKAADRFGIDRKVLYGILTQGAAKSGTLQKMVEPALEGDFKGHAFSLGNGAKDMAYGREMLAGLEECTIITDALCSYYQKQLDKHPENMLLSELLRPA